MPQERGCVLDPVGPGAYVIADAKPEVALDNFCWPDPIESSKTPDGAHKLAQLVRCCQGLREACEAYGLPLISGKDSMKNDAVLDGIKTFCNQYPDKVMIEIMIVKGVNDSDDELGRFNEYLKGLNAKKIQLNTVVRPPAEPSATPVEEKYLKNIGAGGLI